MTEDDGWVTVSSRAIKKKMPNGVQKKPTAEMKLIIEELAFITDLPDELTSQEVLFEIIFRDFLEIAILVDTDKSPNPTCQSKPPLQPPNPPT